MVQTVHGKVFSHWPHTAETQLRFRASPHETWDEKSGRTSTTAPILIFVSNADINRRTKERSLNTFKQKWSSFKNKNREKCFLFVIQSYYIDAKTCWLLKYLIIRVLATNNTQLQLTGQYQTHVSKKLYTPLIYTTDICHLYSGDFRLRPRSSIPEECINHHWYLPLIHTYLLTYSMEQSPSWEANWFCS